MSNFFRMKNYDLKNNTFKDGLFDLKDSTLELKKNLKSFSLIGFIFVAISILKDLLFAQAAVGAVNFQHENSLMLQGSPNTNFIFYVLSFFIAFMVYFFTIDAFGQLHKKSFNLKDSIKFSFIKIFDYKVYLISFMVLLSFLIGLRICLIPLINALPNVSVEVFVQFIQGFSIAAGESQAALSSFIDSKSIYTDIMESVSNISMTSVAISFGFGVLFIICSIVFYFTMFVNIVLFGCMTFFESLKASFILNFRNSLYLMSSTIGILVLFLVSSFINHLVDLEYFSITLNSFVAVYSLYLFTWIISKNTVEKN